MAVKVSTLWKKPSFISLPNLSKLFYIYLATNPHINIVGVCHLNLDIVSIELGISIKEIRDSCKPLVKDNLIKIIKEGDKLFFIIIDHFSTIPKSQASVNKINKTLLTYSPYILKQLIDLGIESSDKEFEFKPPTSKQVSDFALEKGYVIDGEEFVRYYESLDWKDGRGKQVKNWRAKLTKVWFKPDRKLKEVEGAPKGFEFFYVEYEDKKIFPESWVDDLPKTSNIFTTKLLRREYDKRTKNS